MNIQIQSQMSARQQSDYVHVSTICLWQSFFKHLCGDITKNETQNMHAQKCSHTKKRRKKMHFT